MFDFGPERTAFEAQWTPQAYDALTRILLALPIHWRFFVKTGLFEERRKAGGDIDVDTAFAALRRHYPQIPLLDQAA
jgi:N-methylhydantoinase B